ncbi:uncharacterized protein LOC128235633 [Mya arenaria]|uniref:uncharacterized protein LOC128235633 n=1 Tax=Mya arenaria TaxID=6604 RepID=UPI0022E64C71|nr:uncharacterized protein LOC128235633 [Mya arenaria]
MGCFVHLEFRPSGDGVLVHLEFRPSETGVLGHIKVLYMGLVGNIVHFIYISCLIGPWMVLPFELVQGLTHAAVWATTCFYVMQAIPLTLRSSTQGILQGLHHGLGRGCGAVFGGMLVYGYGSEITFRAYGITFIFVLIAFIGVGVYLRRQGVSMESHIPHKTLEDQAMTFNPHGVPSGMARDLSSNKLKQLDEPVKSYGSTLGSDLKSDEGTQPAEQPVEDFNPRADYGYEYNAKVEKVKAIDPRNADTRTEDSINHKRGRTEKQVDDTDGFGRQNKKRDDRQPLTSERDVTDNQPEVKSEIEPHHARTHEAPRRHSLEHSEPRTERRERRRRQSGDIEGLREREDYSGQRESRRYGDEHRDTGHHESRGHHGGKRHSRQRQSMESQPFEDFDPNPREKIVFEQLPDITSRPQRRRYSRDEEYENRQNDPYGQY